MEVNIERGAARLVHTIQRIPFSYRGGDSLSKSKKPTYYGLGGIAGTLYDFGRGGIAGTLYDLRLGVALFELAAVSVYEIATLAIATIPSAITRDRILRKLAVLVDIKTPDFR